ncbi:sulfate transporter family protein [Synechococcus sp. BIOS-U3-1]|uniref:SulP family inorganic anion transporter n=1 Tax=Synechococcus sp. BIOS-U3-1 TaxID=1400865 RepID=UPI001646A913|nr:SulP family inorganic anion transporter [Synechococcus sp. BIOS-U3-1]QNI59769.1 sulfate transporter family protein [Synechococcus sp. BIOS-U3-1]|tara:strand:+ start:3122 stop:4795 length:1674 start_codon:yes stop_codon:yes gene_type:complete
MTASRQPLINGFQWRHWRGDLTGGVTAAVVALPLALAFGNAALGPGGAIYGLYGAIIAGFLAAMFGGTPAQVSGPTGPMSVTVAGVVSSLAAVGTSRELSQGDMLSMVMAAVVLGGLLQILMGILRLGRYITLVPYSVVSGFMSGIGVIILCLQIGPLLGINSQGGVVPSLQMVISNFTPNTAAVTVGIATLAIVFATPRQISKVIPSPLLALLLITPLALWLFPENLPRIGSIPEGGLSFSAPNWTNHFPLLIKAGLVLALLGAIDSLLTSLVADNISHSRHRSDRELVGQGIANSITGLFSGLPGAGATMRTVINIRSGGRTPLSGMTHSVVLLVLLLGAGPLAEGIPTALLAGILIKVGLDIIDWGFLRRAHKLSFKTALVMWGVLLMTVFWDLIGAVLIGMFVANLLTIESLTHHQLGNMNTGTSHLSTREQDLLRGCGDDLILFRMQGPLSFGAAKGISERMMLVRQYKVLLLDITDVPHLGVTASLAIERMVKEAERQQRIVLVAGASGKVKKRLAQFGIENLIDERLQALNKAANWINKKATNPTKDHKN